MQNEYDDKVLQEINANVNLLEYVSQTIEFEKRGHDYFAHCPLHTDVTPSLSITPEKNSYFCFSCHRSGGIIGYLMQFEGMNFESAVQKAASLANVDMSKMCKSQTIIFLKKFRSLQEPKTRTVSHEILPESTYSKYLKTKVDEWLSEGIQQSVMDFFDIRVDERQNRIVYPVRDIDGQLINVKARTRYTNYKELKIPKYINYFPIGVMDYFQSLDMTMPFIKEKNEVIIFESIKSVMKAYGWGYKNCVSAEKHTLTPEQIQLLVKMKSNVVFAYDSDVNYYQTDVKEDIARLKRMVNVYLIEDKQKLLGGEQSKNAPVDCGLEIWETLYSSKRKVV